MANATKRKALVAGLAAGAIINVAEWAAHAWLLDEQWQEAFRALGKVATGWTTFIPSNFVVGIVAMMVYRWSSGVYGPGIRSALRTSLGCWLVFWVIPMLALQPMRIFPDRLLMLTIVIGLIDAPAGILVGARLLDRAE